MKQEYVLLINSARLTTTVVAMYTVKYIDLIMTGFYKLHCIGTKSECDIEELNVLKEFIGE